MSGLSKYLLLKDTRNPILRASVGNSLVLWLDASDSSTITEVAGAVSQWDDKSANGNDALQGTGSKQPTTNATAQNGKNVLNFDNGDTLELPSALYSIPNGNNTLFVVGLHTSSVNDHYISMTEGGASRYYYRTDIDGDRIFAISRNNDANAVVAPITADAFHIGTFFRAGATQSLSIDAATPVTNSFGLNEPGVDAAFIGADEGAGGFLTGSIAEIILYNRALSTTEIRDINRYLATKWAINISAPDNIGGLALWLDANDSSTITESGGLVSQWDDKSGNGNDALQGTGANQPLLVNNLFSGKAAIRFDGINDRLATDGTFAIGSNVTMFVVSKASATNNKQVFIEQSVTLGANDGIQFNSRGNRPVGVRNSAVSVVPPTNTNWMGINLALGSFTYDGASLKYFFNGTIQNTTSGSISNNLVTDNLYIGGRAASGTINTDGDICEILIYDKLLSAEEMDAVDIYLSSKWGITLS